MSIYADVIKQNTSSLINGKSCNVKAESPKGDSAVKPAQGKNTERLNIGLFGFGCVGKGLYDVLNHSQSLKAEIGKICVKDRTKQRSIEKEFFTYERADVLKNNEHDIIVELIDDADAALEIVTDALLKGKDVVTANKKMLAENFELLYKLQLESGASLLYEGACAGSIPIIRTLEEYYDNELLRSVKGVLNGSSNYILTKMEAEGLSYGEALCQAQALGFAESNPALDVGGYDTKSKLCLLAAHAFGLVLKPDELLNIGIGNVTEFDIAYAAGRGARVKLLARCEKTENGKYKAFVLPHFISRAEPLGTVNYEFNGIEVEGVYSDKQFFTGKGAGSHPTGSAVLSDISAITYDYRYGYKKLKKRGDLHGSVNKHDDNKLVDNDFAIRVYIRYTDKAPLALLDIDSVEEEYKSPAGSYIIAECRFGSLFNFRRNNHNGIFICAV